VLLCPTIVKLNDHISHLLQVQLQAIHCSSTTIHKKWVWRTHSIHILKNFSHKGMLTSAHGSSLPIIPTLNCFPKCKYMQRLECVSPNIICNKLITTLVRVHTNTNQRQSASFILLFCPQTNVISTIIPVAWKGM
jgi:hypothetical protein